MHAPKPSTMARSHFFMTGCLGETCTYTPLARGFFGSFSKLALKQVTFGSQALLAKDVHKCRRVTGCVNPDSTRPAFDTRSNGRWPLLLRYTNVNLRLKLRPIPSSYANVRVSSISVIEVDRCLHTTARRPRRAFSMLESQHVCSLTGTGHQNVDFKNSKGFVRCRASVPSFSPLMYGETTSKTVPCTLHGTNGVAR